MGDLRHFVAWQECFGTTRRGYDVGLSVLQVITAERSKADAQQAQVEADSIRIEKEAKEHLGKSLKPWEPSPLSDCWQCRKAAKWITVIQRLPEVWNYKLWED